MSAEVLDVCRGCGSEVDRGCCCCGDAPGGCDNHTFVPMGCRCHVDGIADGDPDWSTPTTKPGESE